MVTKKEVGIITGLIAAVTLTGIALKNVFSKKAKAKRAHVKAAKEDFESTWVEPETAAESNDDKADTKKNKRVG